MHANIIQKGYFEPWIECDQAKFEASLQDSTTESRHSVFSELLGLNELYNDQIRKDAYLEFSEKIVDLCGEYGMTPLKCWTLFKIFKTFHTHCCESDLTPQDACKLFKDILLRHSMERPPFSICIFAFHDVEPIMNFMVNNYFKHYKVYLVAFSGSKLLPQNQLNSTDDNTANKENKETDANQPTQNIEEMELDEEAIKKNKEFEDKFSVELQSLQRIMEEKLETQKQQFLEQIGALKNQLAEKNQAT